MDFRGRWALRAAASMPVQIIRGSGARHQGSPPPSRPQHVEQAAPLGHSPTAPPTRPHTPPMSPPWALSKTSTGLGCLVQIAGRMAWGVQILHTGVGCPNLSSHGRGPHGRGSLSKTFLTWTGSPNLPHGRGALPKSSLTWTFCAATPSRHHHVPASSPRALPHLPAHPLHHGLSRPLSKPCDTSSAKGMRGDIPWWRD